MHRKFWVFKIGRHSAEVAYKFSYLRSRWCGRLHSIAIVTGELQLRMHLQLVTTICVQATIHRITSLNNSCLSTSIRIEDHVVD